MIYVCICTRANRARDAQKALCSKKMNYAISPQLGDYTLIILLNPFAFGDFFALERGGVNTGKVLLDGIFLRNEKKSFRL